MALAASAESAVGVTTIWKEGRLPPVGKKASLISLARWNSRKVVGESARATRLSTRQFHWALEVSTNGSSRSL
ncbi:hypothetical protein D3C87_2168440 [compost metagenome]